MGKVVLSPNITKTSERIDFNGNVIDPRTKQILVPKEVESVLPPPNPTPSEAVIAPRLEVNQTVSAMTIQEQIEATKANLEKLEELKKLKIAEMEKQLELLKK